MTKLIQFDTGVFGLITKRKASGLAWANHATKLGLFAENDIGQMFISPFSIMEFVGIRPKMDISLQIPDDLKASENCAEILSFVRNESRNQFSRNPALKRSVIIDAARRQRTFIKTSAIEIWDEVVEKVIRQEEFQSNLYDSLAFDYSLKHPFPKDLLLKIHGHLRLAVFSVHS